MWRAIEVKIKSPKLINTPASLSPLSSNNRSAPDH